MIFFTTFCEKQTVGYIFSKHPAKILEMISESISVESLLMEFIWCLTKYQIVIKLKIKNVQGSI